MNIFTNENEISFYLLGVYMTDGNVNTNSNQIQLKSKDIDWLENLRIAIAPKTKLSGNRFSFSSKEVKDWLISWGCAPNKSLSLEIKKTIPAQFIPHFLNGVLDGDGWISTHAQNGYLYLDVGICTSSFAFKEQLKKLIPNHIRYHISERLPGKVSLSKNKVFISKNINWEIKFSSNQSIKLLDFIYSSPNLLRLGRKYELYQQYVPVSRIQKGSARPNSKLTESVVRDMLVHIQAGATNNDLAKLYNVSPRLISGIRKGERWKHVTL